MAVEVVVSRANVPVCRPVIVPCGGLERNSPRMVRASHTLWALGCTSVLGYSMDNSWRVRNVFIENVHVSADMAHHQRCHSLSTTLPLSRRSLEVSTPSAPFQSSSSFERLSRVTGAADPLQYEC